MYNIYLSSLLILYTLKCLCFFTFYIYIYALPCTSFNICLFHVALVHVIFGIFGLLFQAFRRFWLSLLFFQKGKLQQKVSRESRILKWHKIQKKYVFFSCGENLNVGQVPQLYPSRKDAGKIRGKESSSST